MKTLTLTLNPNLNRLLVFICALVSLCEFPFPSSAQSLSERLQKGLFEEEANHNLPAAIEEYKAVIAEADQHRRLAATAIFRLAESYRKLGRHDEARPLYERILRDFSDQTELVQRASTRLPENKTEPGQEIPVAGIQRANHLEALDQLIRNSPDLLNATVTNDMTFLQRAASLGDIDLIEFLIQRGAMLERSTTAYADTPLMLAVRHGHKRAAEVLIKAGANVNAIKGGSSPLIISSAHGYLGLTRLLLQSGANVNAQASKGYTALHAAALEGQVEAVKLLVEAGANLNAKFNWWTPLSSAIEKERVNVVRELIRAGADPNEYGKEEGLHPLLLALRTRSFELIPTLLAATNIDVNARDEHRSTPLMVAIEKGRYDAIEPLVKSGANLNATNSLGYTALHLAVIHNMPAMQLLLEAGADPNILPFPPFYGHT